MLSRAIDLILRSSREAASRRRLQRALEAPSWPDIVQDLETA